MQLASGEHLSFCTNIFPGETWGEVKAELAAHLPAIQRRLSPNAPLGLGLRLSAAAADELLEPHAFEELLALLDETNCYVFTLNGFPFGQFHHGSVKESVYLPDWASRERVDYTSTLGVLLGRLAQTASRTPRELSISTVPGGFRSAHDSATRQQVARNLARQALRFHRLELETGVTIQLALEPEPACMLETTGECVAFLLDEVFSQGARKDWPASWLGAPGTENAFPQGLETVLRRHLGLCLDTCHAAVQFEDPQETTGLLRRSGLGVFKLQATTGLQLIRPSLDVLQQLSDFDDGIYLHQGTVRRGERLERFVDLPSALAQAERSGAWGDEWRVHFHVPVFMRDFGSLSSTQADLVKFLREQRRDALTSHIEVETYTFDVLPPQFRPAGVTEAICREVEWTRAQLEAPEEAELGQAELGDPA